MIRGWNRIVVPIAMVLCCICAGVASVTASSGSMEAVRLLTGRQPAPFDVSEAEEDRPMTFNEEAILFELTAHSKGRKGFEKLSVHTQAYIDQEMFNDLRQHAEDHHFSVHETITFEEALAFSRHMRLKSKWNPLKKAWNAAKRVGSAVKNGVKAAGRWVKKKLKALWDKYKCPICKFAVGKIFGFIKEKGVKGVCGFVAKVVCKLAAGGICGPCNVVVCPLVNKFLVSGCEKVVNWLMAKLEDKTGFDEVKVCAAIKLCPGAGVDLSKGAKKAVAPGTGDKILAKQEAKEKAEHKKDGDSTHPEDKGLEDEHEKGGKDFKNKHHKKGGKHHGGSGGGDSASSSSSSSGSSDQQQQQQQAEPGAHSSSGGDHQQQQSSGGSSSPATGGGDASQQQQSSDAGSSAASGGDHSSGSGGDKHGKKHEPHTVEELDAAEAKWKAKLEKAKRALARARRNFKKYHKKAAEAHQHAEQGQSASGEQTQQSSSSAAPADPAAAAAASSAAAATTQQATTF